MYIWKKFNFSSFSGSLREDFPQKINQFKTLFEIKESQWTADNEVKTKSLYESHGLHILKRSIDLALTDF